MGLWTSRLLLALNAASLPSPTPCLLPSASLPLPSLGLRLESGKERHFVSSVEPHRSQSGGLLGKASSFPRLFISSGTAWVTRKQGHFQDLPLGAE